MSTDDSTIFGAFRERLRGATGRNRVYGYIMENADPLKKEMGRIGVEYGLTFDEFCNAALAENPDENPVWLHTTSHDIFADALRETRYGRDALAAVATHWMTLFADADMGAGRGVIVCGDHEVNTLIEPVSHTFRIMTQFTPMTGQRRTLREALLLFHCIILAHKKSEAPAIVRPLLFTVNDSFHQFLKANARAAEAPAVEKSEAADDRPAWQRNMYGPETECQCEGCQLKRISTPVEYNMVMERIGPDRTKEFEHDIGQRAVARYMSALAFGRTLSVEGVSLENRLWAQRATNTVQGAPQRLTRDEMRRIVEDDALWATWEKPPTRNEFISMLKLSQAFASNTQEQLGNGDRVNVAVEASRSIHQIRDEMSNGPVDGAAARGFGNRLSDLIARLRATR